MWNEVILFVPGAVGRHAMRRVLEELAATQVEPGAYQVDLAGEVVEIRDGDDFWRSYTPDERSIVESHLPGAQPILLLYFKRAALIRFVRALPSGVDFLVEDEKAPLKLQTPSEFVEARAGS